MPGTRSFRIFWNGISRTIRTHRNFTLGVGIGLVLGSASVITKPKTLLDATQTLGPGSILVDKGVSLFPTELEIDGIRLELIGTGTRSVSFLGFKVYAAGLYIAKEDISKAKRLLSGKANSKEKLLDKSQSDEVIQLLLKNGVRFDIRIVPVRNTDFGHLRDGFVRAITGNKNFKAEGNNPEIGVGLNELKVAFSGRRSVKKDRIIHLFRLSDGSLRASFFNCNAEGECKEEFLGLVKNQIISEYLFLKYLGGDSPSSPDLQASAAETLSTFS